MSARWLLLTLLALFVPARAAAAPLGELKPFQISGDACVSTTGTQGELTLGTPTGLRFLRATRAGVLPGAEVKLFDTRTEIGEFYCYTAAVRATGAGVIVGSANGDLVAAVRDPGGAWSAPRKLADARIAGSASAAVSDRGDVLIAWTEFDDESRRGLRFARRAPGGAFGKAGTIAAPSGKISSITAALAGSGEASLAWTKLDGAKPPFRASVWVQTAPSGGSFGAPVHVVDTRLHGAPAFAVAPDGRALVAAWNGASLLVAERAPGGAFGPATPVGAATGRWTSASASMATGGAAAIVWARPLEGDALVVTRAAGGAFSAPVAVDAGESLLPAGTDAFFVSESYEQASGSLYPPSLRESAAPRLTGDGRAVIAIPVRRWVARTARTLPTVATIGLGTDAVTTSSATPQFSDYDDDPAPLLLDDGTPAVFWTESDDPSSFYTSKPYRLRVAADGVAEPADPPAPWVTVGTPADRVLDDEDTALELPIRCSAACFVRAHLEYALDPIQGVLRLPRAGRGTLTIENATIAAPARSGPVRVHLSYSAPGALHPVERVETIRLTRTVLIPRIAEVRARRSGDSIRVTWRVKHPSPGMPYYVSGAATRDADGEPLVTRGVEKDSADRELSVTLRNARDVRYVTVRPEIPVGPGAHSVVARVR